MKGDGSWVSVQSVRRQRSRVLRSHPNSQDCSSRPRPRALAAQQPPLTLSHSWMVVTTGAPERKALERAGFRIARTVKRHDGQGTASVTVEFLNGFLELIYPDATVPVCDDLEGRRTEVSPEVRVARDRLFSDRHRLQSHSSNAATAPLCNLEGLCRLDGAGDVH